ncbi:MAG TPA: TetR/AcrR family transcriptional regulator [Streptosporangiaceae bacterium]|jgi:AcrR family transcriptional regulator|nr:TetR/AcrR family transcriptional regulator [Streptosporangiaceae bacterium]
MLDAAARLFARRGVEATSMADIGEEAGYSRGLANHHFGSRVELVERLARRAQSDLVAALGEIGGRELWDVAAMLGIGGQGGAATDLGEGGAADEELLRRLARPAGSRVPEGLGDAGVELRALAVMADVYLAVVGLRSDAARAFFVMWGAAFPEETALRPVFVVDDARFRRGVEKVVRLGQQNLTIKPEIDPAGVAVAVVGMLRGIAAQFTVDPDGVDLAAARRVGAQFLRDTLMPAPVPAKQQDIRNEQT